MKVKFIFLMIFLASLKCGLAQIRPIDVTYKVNQDKSVSFFYEKNVPGTYLINVELTRLDNSIDARNHQILAKDFSGQLFTLRPQDDKKGIGFAYSVHYIRGNPRAKANENIVYALPFETGKNITVYEAQNVGEKYLGSEKPQNWKSFVVNTPEPETMYAMRRGVVIEVVDKYENDPNLKLKYTSKRNSILIEHPDGTYAVYGGFDKNQIFVKLGQEVYPHTPLGRSERFNDGYRSDFYVYHFLPSYSDTGQRNMKNKDRDVNFIDPLFLVDGEKKHLKNAESYKVDFNEDLKLQEFSKREKKRYKKNPEDFK
ncbi:M23 family metallopeptidase [Ornithobacterium rhinotracheale]|uniref:M23 family metallopeptidase n=1 Tax=Ornithobacterium rhinotracheale TaxID=28251 RepID=UPI0040353791